MSPLILIGRAVLAVLISSLLSTCTVRLAAYSSGPASRSQCSIVASGPVAANGVAVSTVRITLRDSQGNPILDAVPQFSATDTNSSNVYGTCTATNSTGVSECSLSSLSAETKTVTLTNPISLEGNTVDFTKPLANLEFPIDLVNYSLSSNTVNVAFSKTTVPITTTDYDGLVTYRFEIVAINADAAPIDVLLLDSTSATKATLTVPAGTALPLRLTVPFSPNAGLDQYRVRLNATSGNDQLVVYTARIVVNQVGASKTRLYFPLLGRGVGNFSRFNNTAVDSHNSAIYTQSSVSPFRLWRNDQSRFKNLAGPTPWTLEVILSTNNAAGTAYASLFNTTTNTQITDSEISLVGNVVSVGSASFGSSAGSFDNLADLEVRTRLASGLDTLYLFRAGLWVTIDNLVKADIFYRSDRARGNTATAFADESRIQIDGSSFSNGTFYFEATGSNSIDTESGVALYSDGVNDVGTTSPSLIAGSTLLFSTVRSRWRSPSFSLGDGLRYYSQHIRTGGIAVLSESAIVISILAQ
jgi:hypothetical protein